jgi:hypothetical protein
MTFILVAGVLGLAIGIWFLNKAKPENQPIDIQIDEELAPEATPAPAVVAEIVKKNTAKKKVAAKPAPKNTAKNKSLAKIEIKPKKKTTKK